MNKCANMRSHTHRCNIFLEWREGLVEGCWEKEGEAEVLNETSFNTILLAVSMFVHNMNMSHAPFALFAKQTFIDTPKPSAQLQQAPHEANPYGHPSQPTLTQCVHKRRAQPTHIECTRSRETRTYSVNILWPWLLLRRARGSLRLATMTLNCKGRI